LDRELTHERRKAKRHSKKGIGTFVGIEENTNRKQSKKEKGRGKERYGSVTVMIAVSRAGRRRGRPGSAGNKVWGKERRVEGIAPGHRTEVLTQGSGHSQAKRVRNSPSVTQGGGARWRLPKQFTMDVFLKT